MTDPIYRAGLWWDSEAEYQDARAAQIAADDGDEDDDSCPTCRGTAPHAYHRDRGFYCTAARPVERAA